MRSRVRRAAPPLRRVRRRPCFTPLAGRTITSLPFITPGRCLMSELRDRMIRDIAVRGLARRTHETNITAVVRLPKYYRRSPDQLTNDQFPAYLAHLILDRQ